MWHPDRATRSLALQCVVAALIVIAGAGTLLMAGQTLPAAKGAALGVFLWSTVSLLALGGASLLALGAGELAHAFHARRPHPAVARPVPNLRRR